MMLNVFPREDLDALDAFVRILREAGDPSRRSSTLGVSPSQRWSPFKPEKMAARLPGRVSHVLARYGWQQTSSSSRNDGLLQEVETLLEQCGHSFSGSELHDVLMAAAFWVDPPAQSVFHDEKALAAFEEFVSFVSGYAQSLPVQFAEGEHVDGANRRFRAYQRRRHGQDAPTRSPKVMIKRLPFAAQEIIDAYGDQLLYATPKAAFVLAEYLAVALGRPLDPLYAHQIEITLATATAWRTITEFPRTDETNAHALLGSRPDESTELFDAARQRVDAALAHVKQSGQTSESFLGQPAALSPVLGVDLDAPSLQSLQTLDDYVNAFHAWCRSEAGKAVQPRRRLATFDAQFRRTRKPVRTGAQLVAALLPSAMKVVANAGALLARGRNIEPAAVEMALALGGKNSAPRCHRTLVTAVAWLNGQTSKMESDPAGVKPSALDDIVLQPFRSAKQRDAEALLDLGASIAEFVRFSQSLDDTLHAPAGWWTKFHRQDVSDGSPASRQLLARLPEGSRRLLQHQARVFSNPRLDDVTSAARALASTLGRDGEVLCVRTLAIALSCGVVWANRDQLSRHTISDTLLGAEPATSKDRYFCGRAQKQLEWGLQELLQSETVVGV
jgi:hypothetical protein